MFEVRRAEAACFQHLAAPNYRHCDARNALRLHLASDHAVGCVGRRPRS
jgi:hypothetical protein